jgi:hypothetical protein
VVHRTEQDILNQVYRESDGSLATTTKSGQEILNLVFDPDTNSLKVSEGATSTRSVVHVTGDTTLSSVSPGAVYHVEAAVSDEVDLVLPDASGNTEGVYATVVLYTGSQINITTSGGQGINGETTQIISESGKSITVLDLGDHYTIIQDNRLGNIYVPYDGMVDDIKTDRWFDNDTNTFLGVGVVGAGALQSPNNTFIGYNAGYSITTGSQNMGIGASALYGVTSGYSNVAVGWKALFNVSDGHDNIALGPGAGENLTTADYCIIIGQQIDAQTATTNGQMSIANAIFGTGNTATGTTISSGNLGLFATSWGTSAARVLAVGNGTAPTTQPADTFQMWSADQAAGNACPHFMTEGGATIKLYQQAHVANATTSHDMTGSDSVDQTNLESALDALGTTLNTILSYLENLGFNATS